MILVPRKTLAETHVFFWSLKQCQKRFLSCQQSRKVNRQDQLFEVKVKQQIHLQLVRKKTHHLLKYPKKSYIKTRADISHNYQVMRILFKKKTIFVGGEFLRIAQLRRFHFVTHDAVVSDAQFSKFLHQPGPTNGGWMDG